MSPSIFLKESEEAFKVVGRKPAGFGAAAHDSKWSVGTKIYHDDYGYGVITSNRMNGNELIIEVQFETGYAKKFLPQYQSKSLQIIK